MHGTGNLRGYVQRDKRADDPTFNYGSAARHVRVKYRAVASRRPRDPKRVNSVQLFRARVAALASRCGQVINVNQASIKERKAKDTELANTA